MVFNTSKLPKWIDKTTDCLYCGKQMAMDDTKVINDDKIQSWFTCHNNDCDSFKWLKRKATQGLTYRGVARIATYRKQFEKDKVSE